MAELGTGSNSQRESYFTRSHLPLGSRDIFNVKDQYILDTTRKSSDHMYKENNFLKLKNQLHWKLKQLPENVKMLVFYVWNCKKRRLFQPPPLDHHLNQVGDAQGSHQPALVCSHIKHCLSRKNTRVTRALWRRWPSPLGSDVSFKRNKDSRALYL